MTEREERDERAKAITAVAETLRHQLSPIALRGYLLALADVPLEALQMACVKAISSSRFMPAPVELRELAGLAEPKPADRALSAWGHVVEAIRKHGAYATVEFDDKAIHGAIRRLGGWLRLCNTDSDELHNWVRKGFLDAYESCARVPDQFPEPLRGIPGDHGKPVRIQTLPGPDRPRLKAV